jgi:hypothetical protein
MPWALAGGATGASELKGDRRAFGFELISDPGQPRSKQPSPEQCASMLAIWMVGASLLALRRRKLLCMDIHIPLEVVSIQGRESAGAAASHARTAGHTCSTLRSVAAVVAKRCGHSSELQQADMCMFTTCLDVHLVGTNGNRAGNGLNRSSFGGRMTPSAGARPTGSPLSDLRATRFDSW